MQKYYVTVGANGNTYWYKDAKRTILHRLNGPAVERADGSKCWFVNGAEHRTDGPAIEYADGSKSWYVEGLLHRTDGPAIEMANGSKWWYLNGEKLTEAKHRRRTQPVAEMTVAEIEKLLGKRIKVVK